jgi:hypothetical protein
VWLEGGSYTLARSPNRRAGFSNPVVTRASAYSPGWRSTLAQRYPSVPENHGSRCEQRPWGSPHHASGCGGGWGGW